jgi:hypothetical protein
MFITPDDHWELIDLRHVMSVDREGSPAEEKTRDKLDLDDQE